MVSAQQVLAVSHAGHSEGSLQELSPEPCLSCSLFWLTHRGHRPIPRAVRPGWGSPESFRSPAGAPEPAWVGVREGFSERGHRGDLGAGAGGIPSGREQPPCGPRDRMGVGRGAPGRFPFLAWHLCGWLLMSGPEGGLPGRGWPLALNSMMNYVHAVLSLPGG